MTPTIIQLSLVTWIPRDNKGVVVGWEGGLRWTYTGHSKINVTTQFLPTDVVTTTAGHIIVCDYRTHALLKLDSLKKFYFVYCCIRLFIFNTTHP
jgi:hypothetical protein